MATHSADPIEVFYSYSHKDERLLKELVEHLANLKRQGIITHWHDRKITAGSEWENEINEHLEKARVILLLISASFMASDYCNDVEIRRALERHEAGEARVIPVLLRAVDWSGACFSHLQFLPSNAKPIMSWTNRDKAFADVATGIRTAIEELLANIRAEFPSPTILKETQSPDFPDKTQAIDPIRNKLIGLHQLEKEALIDKSIKQEYQRRLLDKWIETK